MQPPPPARGPAATRDVWHGLGDGNIGWRDTARMAWRHALTEWRALVALMNTERLRERWAANAASPGRPTFLADGSRPFSGAETTVELVPLDALPPSVMPEYLAYDLSRLAAIHNPGGRLIVYESPLAPGLDHADSPNAIAVRERLRAVCAALPIECRLAPMLEDGSANGGDGPYWDDVSHAPGPLLGEWLADLVAAGRRSPES